MGRDDTTGALHMCGKMYVEEKDLDSGRKLYIFLSFCLSVIFRMYASVTGSTAILSMDNVIFQHSQFSSSLISVREI